MAPAVMVTKTFEEGPDKASAQQVVPLLCFLLYVYCIKTKYLFRVPLRIRTYQGNVGRTYEMLGFKELTKPNKVPIKVLNKQLKSRLPRSRTCFCLLLHSTHLRILRSRFVGTKSLSRVRRRYTVPPSALFSRLL